MCKQHCENYKPFGKKECYKNKCDTCECKNCNDNNDCETRIAKCLYCKHVKISYWTYTYPSSIYTQTDWPNSYATGTITTNTAIPGNHI